MSSRGSSPWERPSQAPAPAVDAAVLTKGQKRGLGAMLLAATVFLGGVGVYAVAGGDDPSGTVADPQATESSEPSTDPTQDAGPSSEPEPSAEPDVTTPSPAPSGGLAPQESPEPEPTSPGSSAPSDSPDASEGAGTGEPDPEAPGSEESAPGPAVAGGPAQQAVPFEVTAGDTYWGLTQAALELTQRPVTDGNVVTLLPEFIDYNSGEVVDPDLIYPGQVLIWPQGL